MRRTFVPIGFLAAACLTMLALATPSASAPACTGIAVTAAMPKAQNGQAIRNASELSAALRAAQGGETFFLAGGDYGRLKIRTDFKKLVTIRSDDPGTPACFTEMRLDGAGNISFEGLIFDYTYAPGDKHFTHRFTIQNSRNITISNSVFDGGQNGPAGHGRGLNIRDSANVTIENSVFRLWWKALTADSITNLTIRGNTFYNIRSDGIGLGVIDGGLIEANHMHNFRRLAGSNDHADMIQIQRSSNRRSTNIEIRDNILDMGAGDYTQTIWMGGDGKDLNDPMLRHQNVLIENNVIYNAQAHGISVHGVDNLSIRKNSVIRVRRPAETGGVTIPRISAAWSTSVVIEQNVTSDILGYENQRDWVVLNNVIVQDENPSANGFYDREFIYYATGPTNGYNEYGVRPGSTIDRLDAGSTLVKNYPTRQ